MGHVGMEEDKKKNATTGIVAIAATGRKGIYSDGDTSRRKWGHWFDMWQLGFHVHA